MSSALADWVRRIGEEEMPVFAQTARLVAGLSAKDSTSIGELARAVLIDSAMTARVLRLANSVYFNPSSKRITTVSRAIVMLGFDTVRAIALSVAMIDTLLSGKRHDRVVREMACAFHAAVQARALAGKLGDPAVEEVFIAALLRRLGALAFWCFPHGLETVMEATLAGETCAERAEAAVLGFGFDELTLALNHEWRLSDLLGQLLDGRHRDSLRVQIIELAWAIALGASEMGWTSKAVEECLRRAATLLHCSPQEVAALLHAAARDAVRIAVEYGAEAAARRIPLPLPASELKLHIETPPDKPGEADFQLRILRELSAMLAERVDINALFGTVLEGIYRGVGVDRAVLALLTANDTRLKLRHALGQEGARLKQCFDFALDDESRGFAPLLIDGAPAHLQRATPSWRAVMTPQVAACLGEVDFLVFPLLVGGRPRGLFYADRARSGRPFLERDIDAFRHFCEQAVIGLAVAGLRGG